MVRHVPRPHRALHAARRGRHLARLAQRGTPAALGPERVAAVLAAVRDRFPLKPGAEVTTEANPESTSPEFFDAIRAAGYTWAAAADRVWDLHVGTRV